MYIDPKKENFDANSVIKTTLPNGNIEMIIISQSPRTRTEFGLVSKYMNELVEEGGYQLVQTEECTLGDYATYTDSHQFIQYDKDEKVFKVKSAPAGDIPDYDHEWVRFTFAKEEKEVLYESGDKVEVIFSVHGEHALEIKELTIKKSFGGYIEFEEIESNHELGKLLGKPNTFFQSYAQSGHFPSFVISPNEEFKEKYIAVYEAHKNSMLLEEIKDFKKSIKEMKKGIKTPIRIINTLDI